MLIIYSLGINTVEGRAKEEKGGDKASYKLGLIPASASQRKGPDLRWLDRLVPWEALDRCLSSLRRKSSLTGADSSESSQK